MVFSRLMAAIPVGGTSAAAPSLGRGRVGPATLAWVGASLARRGPMAIASMVVSALTVLVLAALALSYATRGEGAPVRSVPSLAASGIAWGGAFLHAVVASMSVFRRDRADGILGLFIARTNSTRDYVIARIGGLALLLGAAVVGGTLVVSAVGVLGASRGADAWSTIQATISACAFGVAYALVIAPVALAALGGRSRGGGYLVLLLVLVVPEWVAGRLNAFLPEEITELCAIPSALSALRASLFPGTVDVLRALRAVVALGAVSALASVFVYRDVVRIESEVP